MDLDFYKSSLDTIAIGVCAGAAYLLYQQQKHYSVALIAIGFLIAVVTHASINYCISIALFTDLLSSHPILCSPVIPYVKGAGYLMIFYGLLKFKEHLKNA